MSIYSDKQRLFQNAFMTQADALCTHYLSDNKQNQDLDQAISAAVDVISGGISLVSLVLTPPTVGVSLAIGATCILLVKTGAATYQYLRSQNRSDPLAGIVNVAFATQRLSLWILLRQTAALLSIRYAHVINDVIDTHDIDSFANFGFAVVLQKIKQALSQTPQTSLSTQMVWTLPSAQVLADELLSGVSFSNLFDTHKISLNQYKKRFGSLIQEHVNTQFLYARPRWMVYDTSVKTATYWGSAHESLLKLHSTLPEYGWLSLTPRHLIQHQSAVRPTSLRQQTPITSSIQKNLYVYHQVSRQEVESYLQELRTQQHAESLNEYLSRMLQLKVIACCHDDSLKGLDLSAGDFSEVDFHHAQLQDCSLAHSKWQDAHLEYAQFSDNDMSAAVFCNAYLEFSQWRQVAFDGDFSHAHMNGAQLTNCNIKLSCKQNNCDWELCIQDEVTVNQEQLTFNHVIDERLTEELHARIALSEHLQQQVDEIKQDLQLVHIHEHALQDRVAVLESEYDLFAVIRRHWHIWFNTPEYQNEKHNYVELSVACSSESNSGNMLVSERLESFLQTDEDVLVIKGDAGSGKTLLAVLFEEELLRRFHQPTDWLPIYIRVSDIPHTEDNFFMSALKTRLTDAQIMNLKHYRCVIILDGLEQTSFPLKHRRIFEEGLALKEQIFASNGLKILIMAQNRFLLELGQDYADVLSVAPHTRLPLQADCSLQAPSPAQFEQMLILKNVDPQVIKSLKASPELWKTPLMFKLLSEWAEHISQDASVPTSRANLYTQFCTDWFERIKMKLSPHTANINRVQFHLQALAFEMFKTGRYYLERPYLQERENLKKDQVDPLSTLFENKTNRFSPLIVSKQVNKRGESVLRYEFIHHSFRDFLLAERLLNDLLGRKVTLDNLMSHWHHHAFLDMPDVLYFFRELAQHHEEKELITTLLLQMVYASRQRCYQTKVYASSNALSLLCQLGFDLSNRNLVDIQAPKTNFGGGNLAFTRLNRSDLQASRFHDAMLLNSDLGDSVLTDALFTRAPFFIQTSKPPQTFAIYPHSTETMVAFDVPSEIDDHAYGIAIARLSDGKVYQYWHAHHQPIHALAWTTYDNVARLASGGDDGVVRIWQQAQNQASYATVIEAVKLDCFNQQAIMSVIWHANGYHLAIASKDNRVRICDVNQNHCVFTSPAYSGVLHQIQLGQITPALFACGSDDVIRVWENPLQNPLALPQERNLYTILSRQQAGHIQSMALSPNEQQVALGTDNGDILLFDWRDSAKDLLFRIGHTDKITSMVWAQQALMSASEDRTVRIWPDLNKNDAYVFQHDSQINKIELAADGKQLLSGGGGISTYIYAWDISRAQHNQIDPHLFGHVTCMQSCQPIVSENRHFLAAGFMNGATVVWSLNSAEQSVKKNIVTILQHVRGPVSHVSWSYKGQLLASLSQFKSIIIKDMRHPNPLDVHIQAPDDVWFNDIHWLQAEAHQYFLAAAASDGSIYIYDARVLLTTEYSLQELTPCCIVSPHSQQIAEHASITQEKNVIGIRCFSVAPRQYDETASWLLISRAQSVEWVRMSSPTCDNYQMMYHFQHPNSHAVSINWSVDGTYFVTSDKNQSVYVWHSQSRACVFVQKQPEHIQSIIWHPNWLILNTSQTVHLWPIPVKSSWTAEAAKQVSIRASYVSSTQNELLLARDQGIYALNLSVLVAKSLCAEAWSGVIKKSLIVDGCALTADSGLDKNTESAMVAKGAVVSSSSFGQLYRFFANASHAERLPRPLSSQAFLNRFNLFPAVTEEGTATSSPQPEARK